jgi:hypothetical protein
LMCINSGRAFSPLGRRYVPLGAYVFEMEGKTTL